LTLGGHILFGLAPELIRFIFFSFDIKFLNYIPLVLLLCSITLGIWQVAFLSQSALSHCHTSSSSPSLWRELMNVIADLFFLEILIERISVVLYLRSLFEYHELRSLEELWKRKLFVL
jgi:hypothetical protein